MPQLPSNQLSGALSALQREVPAATSNVSQLAAPSNSMLAKHWMLATPENETLDSCTALDDLFSTDTIDHMLGSGMGGQQLNSSSRGSSQDMQSGQVGHSDGQLSLILYGSLCWSAESALHGSLNTLGLSCNPAAVNAWSLPLATSRAAWQKHRHMLCSITPCWPLDACQLGAPT